MPGLLIIAHAPLASALRAVAQHTFPERLARLEFLDVYPTMGTEEIEASARLLLDRVRNPDALILTDVFGATPCNVAQKIAQTVSDDACQIKLVAGVNVPMIWRALCYEEDSIDMLVNRAISGATQGVMPVGIPRPQNQAAKGVPHDQGYAHHQQ
jgi:PTS system mannose-specific IIA component